MQKDVIIQQYKINLEINTKGKDQKQVDWGWYFFSPTDFKISTNIKMIYYCIIKRHINFIHTSWQTQEITGRDET